LAAACGVQGAGLIYVKSRISGIGILTGNFKAKREVAVPVDSILVSIAVVAMFLIFAGVLWWGDRQTSSLRHGNSPRSQGH